MTIKQELEKINKEYTELKKHFFGIKFKNNQLKYIFFIVINPFLFCFMFIMCLFFRDVILPDLNLFGFSRNITLLILSPFLFFCFYYSLCLMYLPYYSFFKYIHNKKEINNIQNLPKNNKELIKKLESLQDTAKKLLPRN